MPKGVWKRERSPWIRTGIKKCTVCGKDKKWPDDFANGGYRNGIQRHKPWCKPCAVNKTTARHATPKGRESHRAADRRYSKTPKRQVAMAKRRQALTDSGHWRS